MSFERKRVVLGVAAVVVAVFVNTGCQKGEKPVPKRVTLNALPIEFYDAQNLVTSLASYREYKEDRDSRGNPEGLSFVRQADNKKILPGSSEYSGLRRDWKLIAGPQEIESVTVLPGTAEVGTSWPLVKFKSEAAWNWEMWSRANNKRGEKIAVVVDGRVLLVVPIPKDQIVKGEIEVPISANLVRR